MKYKCQAHDTAFKQASTQLNWSYYFLFDVLKWRYSVINLHKILWWNVGSIMKQKLHLFYPYIFTVFICLSSQNECQEYTTDNSGVSGSERNKSTPSTSTIYKSSHAFNIRFLNMI